MRGVGIGRRSFPKIRLDFRHAVWATRENATLGSEEMACLKGDE